MIITLQDMVVLLGLSIDGPVSQGDRDMMVECTRLLGRQPP